MRVSSQITNNPRDDDDDDDDDHGVYVCMAWFGLEGAGCIGMVGSYHLHEVIAAYRSLVLARTCLPRKFEDLHCYLKSSIAMSST